MELPMVVSRSTGCIDSIVENETGIYCDITPESIADAIASFFDREKARRFGKAARAFVVENFEHSIVREEMLGFLNKVTSAR